MGRVEGKVALISGGARGQGRSHAIRLADEGADIIVFDVCEPCSTIPYDLATESDLNETVKAVEALGRRVIAKKLDARDSKGLRAIVGEGLAAFGRLDIVIANAGIMPLYPFLAHTDEIWDDVIATNLTGVFKTIRAALPGIIEGGRGGSVVVTSSTAGVKGLGNSAGYSAAKHAVIGLTRVIANEFAQQWIRANAVLPTTVNTGMIRNQSTFSLMAGGDPEATEEQAIPVFSSLNALPLPWIEPLDVSNAIIWLCSDEARYITGIALSVDAGCVQK